MHFGTISRCEQDTDLVAGPVKLSRFAAGGPVEEVDHAPGNILGIGFQCSVREHGKEVGPDRGKGLLDRVLAGKVALVEWGRPDAEA